MSAPVATPVPAAAGPTVYYDGACPVCSREIAVYRRQPGADACRWVDVASCADAELGTDLTRQAALARLHVRQPDGRLVHGAQGFAAMWQALPRTAWLGRVAAWAPVTAVLELAYRGFLWFRRAWRRPAAAPRWPSALTADLRSDDAGETGAVQIYRGVLTVSRDRALRAFAAQHLATEQRHLRIVQGHLPRESRSRLLPAWRVAGWFTGALPALFGPRAVYATIAAVETFVDRHYAEQIERLDALLAAGTDAPEAPAWRALRDDLDACRKDEIDHRDEALRAGPAEGPAVRLWTGLVARGSAAAVGLARRF